MDERKKQSSGQHLLRRINWEVPVGCMSDQELQDFSERIQVSYPEKLSVPLQDLFNLFLAAHFSTLIKIFSLEQENIILESQEHTEEKIAVFHAPPASELNEEPPKIQLNQVYFEPFIKGLSLHFLAQTAKARGKLHLLEMSDSEFNELEKHMAIMLASFVQALAHEMYHARQYFQDKEYYLETARANLLLNLIPESLYESIRTFHPDGLTPAEVYASDHGERAADAVSLKYLKFAKNFHSSNEASNPIDKLTLGGIDEISDQVLIRLKSVKHQKKK